MTGAEAVELCSLLRPHTAIPIHYEGWNHFRAGREGVEQALAEAAPEVAGAFRRLEIGAPTEVEV